MSGMSNRVWGKFHKYQNGTVQSVLDLVFFVFFLTWHEVTEGCLLINTATSLCASALDWLFLCLFSFFQELTEKLLDAESSRVGLKNEVIQSLFPLLSKWLHVYMLCSLG